FSGVFGQDIYLIAREFTSDISPAEWTYYAYIPIWTWQLLWIFFGIGNDCRRTKSGRCVSDYDVISNDVFISYSLANIILTIWMQLLTRKRIIFSSVACMFVFVLLVVGCARSCRHIQLHLEDLLKAELGKDVWYVRIVLHNGLACYALLICQVMLENTVASIFYTYDVRDDAVSYASTSTLALVVLIMFWLDLLVFDKFMRYLIAPYFFYLYILTGLFAKNYNIGSNIEVSMFLTCLASCSVLLLFTKILMTVRRHNRYPLGNRYTYDVAETSENE
ncbi:uncharacterized protein LOC132739804, partial [Ruditapes philippinarum]|uniref:uncharacterized protein LOC132739804 n=1 Tax=Ruditapes philippinarum TaxID=129788 RepID=UPI00295AB2BF